MAEYRLLSYPVGIIGLTLWISEAPLRGGIYRSKSGSLNPNLRRKEVKRNGSADFNGTFRTG
jgi:hypothetical protein